MSERRSELKAVASTEDMTAHKTSERDVMQMNTKMMDGWSQIQGRMMSLAQASLRNNMNAVEEMRQCQNPKEVIDLQMKLIRQNYDDAIDGARQISDIMTKMSTEALGSFPLPR